MRLSVENDAVRTSLLQRGRCLRQRVHVVLRRCRVHLCRRTPSMWQQLLHRRSGVFGYHVCLVVPVRHPGLQRHLHELPDGWGLFGCVLRVPGRSDRVRRRLHELSDGWGLLGHVLHMPE
ncbi:MAG: hypothetical protein JWP02_3359 [Acidimicrobiales bacterium]|nr:hypothetical protein [Acidimicrobiales bacterium]